MQLFDFKMKISFEDSSCLLLSAKFKTQNKEFNPSNRSSDNDNNDNNILLKSKALFQAY